MTEALDALAANILSRHKARVEPYVLFIGAGASISSGCSSMLTLAGDLLRSHDYEQISIWEVDISEAEKLSPAFGDLQRREIDEKKIIRFFEIWGTLDGETKYAFLRKHLSDAKIPSQGYLELAHLIKSRFFTTILTTNLDMLLERALQRVGLLQSEDFIVVTNRRDAPAEISDQLENCRAPIKIVKLHGTLQSPRSYAFTPEEIFAFEKSIRSLLTRILNQSLVVVGHSMQDRDINMLFEREGKEIHYVNPIAPRRGSFIDNILSVRSLGSTIVGSDGLFDNFFEKLHAAVESLSTASLNSDSDSSIETFLQSIGLESELKAPRSRYKNLQMLYVKPTEYDDILSKLESEHVIFIIGEPHMGKTYTGLYLLWEYHKKGYETLHIRHDHLRHLLHRHDNNLKELLLELFTPKNQRPRILHFDDPFGETSERRTEAIANKLDTFIEIAKSYEHLRVIVTSRLNIFNETLDEQLINTDVLELEETLRVHTSYSRDVLLDILHRYVNFYTPAWANDGKIVAELDEKLPSMLPAPHNIEFFVSTSEELTSLEALLSYVEDSKKMISALAEWMRHMSPHEQIFLMWVEICSTAGVLFAGASASETDVEKAYIETLAFLFRQGHLPGIPLMPFPSSRDKFETILIERRDECRLLKLDFVHPSYHEAFWYAVNRKFPMAKWWELLCVHIEEILKNLPDRVDLVQLKVIERYGTINRDLDQLLLLSAVSDDPTEQLIALDHMLKRPDEFASVTQFTTCISSIVSHDDPSIRIGFLDLYNKHFDQLPLEVMQIGLRFIFDEEKEVRVKAKGVIGNRMDAFPEALREEEFLKDCELLRKLSPTAFRQNEDLFEYLAGGFMDSAERFDLRKKIADLSLSEIRQLTQLGPQSTRKRIVRLFDSLWDNLSIEQRQEVALSQLSESRILRSRIERLVADLPDAFMHLPHKYPVIRDLVDFQEAFKLDVKDGDTQFAFKSLSVKNWPRLSQETIRELSCISAADLGFLVTTRILENSDEFSLQDRNAYLESLYIPTSVATLTDYIKRGVTSKLPREYSSLSDSVLIKLLSAEGRVQFEVLTSILLRFDRLSDHERKFVDDLLANPPDWWVGASVGQLCTSIYSGRLGKSAENLPFHILNAGKKRVNGAMLAEIAQSYLDASFGLQGRYDPLLRQLIRDPEVVQYAEHWMEHSRQVFRFFNMDYWDGVRSRMKMLQP